jgi:hypothetical protein
MGEHIPNGYVVIARKIRKSPLWLSLKATHRLVMIELLLQAQFQDGQVVRNGEILDLKRGQLATSYQQIVDDISDKDVTVKVVRNAINKLVSHDFLAKDEAKIRAKKGLLITIANYGFYQDADNYKGKEEGKDKGSKRAKQGQSQGKARAISNNVNNSNNSNNVKNKYLECVFLTDDQYGKLIEKFGNQERVNQAIEILNNYIQAKEPKYKSHYHVLIGWVFEKVMGTSNKKQSTMSEIEQFYLRKKEEEEREAIGRH